MEVGYPGRRAVSFAEIRTRLILYGKNCLGKRAHKADCAYVIPVNSEGILERIPLFTHTDIASDSRMSSPLSGLPWFDDNMWKGASRLVS